MPVPYEHVIRHEIPPFARACIQCVQQVSNTRCDKEWCHCLCRLAPGPVALDDFDIPDPTEWHEPPARPEPLDTWHGGGPDKPPAVPAGKDPRGGHMRNLTEKGESDVHTEPKTLWEKFKGWLNA